MRAWMAPCVVLLLAACGCVRPAPPKLLADLVIRHAAVHTMDDKLPRATALAVQGDRILWVGDESAASPVHRREDARSGCRRKTAAAGIHRQPFPRRPGSGSQRRADYGQVAEGDPRSSEGVRRQTAGPEVDRDGRLELLRVPGGGPANGGGLEGPDGRPARVSRGVRLSHGLAEPGSADGFRHHASDEVREFRGGGAARREDRGTDRYPDRLRQCRTLGTSRSRASEAVAIPLRCELRRQCGATPAAGRSRGNHDDRRAADISRDACLSTRSSRRKGGCRRDCRWRCSIVEGPPTPRSASSWRPANSTTATGSAWRR